MRDDELMHYAEKGQNILMHFGIPGQKKGRRRWQNKDGSLTPEGYIHYGYGLPDHENENENHYSGKTEGRGTNSNGSHGPYAKDKKYTKDDYVDADYRDIDIGDVRYKERDAEESDYEDILKSMGRKTSAREGFATAASTVSAVSNALTKDQPIIVYDDKGNPKNVGKTEAPLKTLADRDKKKKQAKVRAMNQASIQNLSNQELQAIIDRKRLENTYLDMTTPEVQSGYEKTMQILGVVGALAGTSLAVMQVANQVRQAKG